MSLINAKLNDEQFIGLVLGDVVRYVLRYTVTANDDDLEKALTMLAWGVHRRRKRSADAD